MKKQLIAALVATTMIALSGTVALASSPFCEGGIVMTAMKSGLGTRFTNPFCSNGIYRVSFQKQNVGTVFTGKTNWSDVMAVFNKPTTLSLSTEFLPGARQTAFDVGPYSSCSPLIQHDKIDFEQSQYLVNLPTCVGRLSFGPYTQFDGLRLIALDDAEIAPRLFSPSNLPTLNDYSHIKGRIRLKVVTHQLPFPDADGDGFSDDVDNCPHTPFPTNLGCPLN